MSGSEEKIAGTILSQLEQQSESLSQDHDEAGLRDTTDVVVVNGSDHVLLHDPSQLNRNVENSSLGKDPKNSQRKSSKLAYPSKRVCKSEGCGKKDQGGGFCYSHGGGNCCQTDGCKTKSQPGKKFCYKHDKSASMICRFKDCTRKNAGRGFCIAHGGGKRCQFENCGKSAQRRGFCKNHGGIPGKCVDAGCQKTSAKSGYCKAHYLSYFGNGYENSALPSRAEAVDAS